MRESVIQELLTRKLPVVTVDSAKRIPGTMNVATDFRAAGRLAAEKLLERGHRDILFCGLLNDDSLIERECYDGFGETLAARGVKLDESRIFPDIRDFDALFAKRLNAGLTFTAAFLAHHCFLAPILETFAARPNGAPRKPDLAMFGKTKKKSGETRVFQIQCPVSALSRRAAELIQGAIKGKNNDDAGDERLAPIWVEPNPDRQNDQVMEGIGC